MVDVGKMGVFLDVFHVSKPRTFSIMNVRNGPPRQLPSTEGFQETMIVGGKVFFTLSLFQGIGCGFSLVYYTPTGFLRRVYLFSSLHTCGNMVHTHAQRDKMSLTEELASQAALKSIFEPL